MAADDKARFFARTMHTPDDAERAELRSALRELSKQLIPLHRVLIDSAKHDYAVNVGPISSAQQFIQLLQEDERFAWLRPLTSLIVDIDELARRDFARPDVDDIAKRTDRLFGPASDDEFAINYIPVLQRDVAVAVAHAAIRKLLTKLS